MASAHRVQVQRGRLPPGSTHSGRARSTSTRPYPGTRPRPSPKPDDGPARKPEGYRSVITPRAINHAPAIVTPSSAAIRPRRCTQDRNPATAARVRSGANRNPSRGSSMSICCATQKYVTRSTVATIPRIEMMDVVQRVEVGDSGKAQQDAHHEGQPGIALAQHPHRHRLGRLARLAPRPQLRLLARTATPLNRWAAPDP